MKSWVVITIPGDIFWPSSNYLCWGKLRYKHHNSGHAALDGVAGVEGLGAAAHEDKELISNLAAQFVLHGLCQHSSALWPAAIHLPKDSHRQAAGAWCIQFTLEAHRLFPTSLIPAEETALTGIWACCQEMSQSPGCELHTEGPWQKMCVTLLQAIPTAAATRTGAPSPAETLVKHWNRAQGSGGATTPQGVKGMQMGHGSGLGQWLGSMSSEAFSN